MSSLPDSMEEYYEFVVATGRDGLPSTCSFIVQNCAIVTAQATQEKRRRVNHFESELINMVTSCKKCYRVAMLQYFDLKLTEKCNDNSLNGDCCAGCDAKLFDIVPLHLKFHEIDERGMLDVTEDARDIVELVDLVKCSSIDFLEHENHENYINFLCGKYFEGAENYPLQFFGKGSKKPRDYWSLLLNSIVIVIDKERMLLYEKYGERLTLTKKGRKFLNNKSLKLKIDPKKETDFIKFLKRNDKIFEAFEVYENSGEFTYYCVNE